MVGIGLDWDSPHALPFVNNKDDKNNGIRIQPGLTIAIEPLLVLGKSNNTKVSSDGWTVYAEDICSHAEHTVFVHEDHVEIITERQS